MTAQPAGVNLDGALTISNPDTAQQIALIGGVQDASSSTIDVIFVGTMNWSANGTISGLRGFSEPPYWANRAGGTPADINTALVGNGATPFTGAHEIGHILTNAGHYTGTDPVTGITTDNDLMRNGTSSVDTVGATKRLTDAQITAARGSGLVQQTPTFPPPQDSDDGLTADAIAAPLVYAEFPAGLWLPSADANSDSTAIEVPLQSIISITPETVSLATWEDFVVQNLLAEDQEKLPWSQPEESREPARIAAAVPWKDPVDFSGANVLDPDRVDAIIGCWDPTSVRFGPRQPSDRVR